jgi:chromosome partitioning protein
MHKPDELPTIARDYHLVVVDLPPRHAEIQRSALLVADQAILPCGGSSSDAWALLASLRLVEEAQKLRPKLEASILLNRIRASTAIGRGARDVLSSTGWRVLDAELHDRIAYQEAIGEGLGPAQYQPKSDAAAEVRALVDELLPQTRAKARKAVAS